MRLLVLVWVAAGMACGDEGVTTRDATTTDAADAVFVPGDIASTDSGARDTSTTETRETNDVSEPAETVVDVTSETGDDTAAPGDTAQDSAADSSATADVVDVSVDVPVESPLGDDCARPRELADPDEDDHYDALGDLGVAAGLADDLDARVCGISDANMNGQGKVDEAWRFVAPATGEYKIAALSDTNIDLVVYVLALGDDGNCGACLGFTDSGGAGDIDERVVALAAGDAVVIVVDGKTTTHAGAYLVDVYACGDACE